MVFFTDDESEKEGELASVTSLSHRNRRNKGPIISVETDASEEPVIAEESSRRGAKGHGGNRKGKK